MKPNNDTSEIDEVLNPPTMSRCDVCGGVGHYQTAISTTTNPDPELMTVQICQECDGIGKVGYSPTLAKQTILSKMLTKQQVLEAIKQAFSYQRLYPDEIYQEESPEEAREIIDLVNENLNRAESKLKQELGLDNDSEK